jgi:hypothetical protein
MRAASHHAGRSRGSGGASPSPGPRGTTESPPGGDGRSPTRNASATPASRSRASSSRYAIGRWSDCRWSSPGRGAPAGEEQWPQEHDAELHRCPARPGRAVPVPVRARSGPPDRRATPDSGESQQGPAVDRSAPERERLLLPVFPIAKRPDCGRVPSIARQISPTPHREDVLAQKRWRGQGFPIHRSPAPDQRHARPAGRTRWAAHGTDGLGS